MGKESIGLHCPWQGLIHLASQPDSTPHCNQLQPLPDPADPGSLTPASDTDLITADGCAYPSPQMTPPRTQRNLLRERQIVENVCPAQMLQAGSTSGSATRKHSEIPTYILKVNSAE